MREPGSGARKQGEQYLRGVGVDYEEFDLSHDKAGQAFMKLRGYTGLPVTVIDGEEIVGYDMPRIQKALGLDEQNEVK